MSDEEMGHSGEERAEERRNGSLGGKGSREVYSPSVSRTEPHRWLPDLASQEEIDRQEFMDGFIDGVVAGVRALFFLTLVAFVVAAVAVL